MSDLLTTIAPDTEIDYYGVGGVVRDLEAKVAELLAKPAALFVPSGTMAQQIVLRVLGERRGSKTVAFHPACHLDTHEERGYQKLHGLFAVPVGPRNEPLSIQSLAQVHEPVGALLIELPQRDLGGVLPSWDELNAQVDWAHEHGAAVHLDGARLWEATPHYKKSPAEIAALFDTVYVSFYKGLGGISGCCVAGERDVIEEVSTWRTRHGGRLFGLWPYAASALTVLERRLPLMPKYHRRAVAIGRALYDLPGVEVLPYPVQSPMMHLRLDVGVRDLRARALAMAREEKVWTFARPFASEGASLQRIEFNVGDATLAFTPAEVRELVERLVRDPKKGAKPAPGRTTPTKRSGR
ncbi:MAG TPA: beta-eliminating lyase-related protein [Acidimicrobiales bacterium]|nr:beta-eliminating lyase-related protein [Acidimicrobiales bacterium]